MLWSLLVVCLVLLVVYSTLIKPYRYWSNRNVAGCRSWPFFGIMAIVGLGRKAVIYWVEDIYNLCKGRYMGMYQFFSPSFLIKDIDLIKQITIKDFDYFTDHNTFSSEEDLLFGNNLLAMKGQKWRNMRATLSPAFTGSKMRCMFVLMRDCAKEFAEYFSKNNTDEIAVVEMKDIYSRLANDIIATCAFGIKCNSMQEKDNEFYMMGKRITNFSSFQNMIVTCYIIFPKLMKYLAIPIFDKTCQKYFKNIIINNIAARERENIIRMDLIHLLMEARKGKLNYDENKSSEQDTGFATADESAIGKKHVVTDLTDDVITAQALIFFFAGFETISTVMCLTSYELALNPDIQKKLQDEIDETMADCDGSITYDALVKMKYLDMVLSESMRLWPPGFVLDRLCVKPYTIESKDSSESPVHLVPGDVISVPVFGIHRDPKYYPNPGKFDPERFNDENKKNIKPFTYLPFGIGPRNCIGSRFALIEAKITLFYLLSKFDIVVVEKTQIPIQFKKMAIAVISEEGYWLGLKRRSEN